jgi:hypothetical protein
LSIRDLKSSILNKVVVYQARLLHITLVPAYILSALIHQAHPLVILGKHCQYLQKPQAQPSMWQSTSTDGDATRSSL